MPSYEQALINRLPRDQEMFAAGAWRIAGGKITIAANQTGVFQISNPTGSNTIVTIREFVLGASNQSDAQFVLNPTSVNSPTNISIFQPNTAVPTANVATVRSGITGYTGGTLISPVYLIPNQIPIDQLETVLLAPGVSMAVALTVPALTTTSFYVSCGWTEEPLSPTPF